MEKIHPKRRHDKDNPYTIWKEEDGSCHLSFFDGERKFHELEIPPQLYQLFDRFELEDLSHLNKVDRHWSEEELNGKLVEHILFLNADSKVEQQVENRVFLRPALAGLSPTQRRRLILYTVRELTFEEIARTEKCSRHAVEKSVAAALKKIQKYFK